MDTTHKEYINLTLSRREAELLSKLIEKESELQSPRKDLEAALAPIYNYQIRCTECGRNYTHSRSTILPQDTELTGVCSWCMDDFK